MEKCSQVEMLRKRIISSEPLMGSQTHDLPEYQLGTLTRASYTDILWACHAIFLPQEGLLKPREHCLPFVCLCPNHGCRLCPKDQLEIMCQP